VGPDQYRAGTTVGDFIEHLDVFGLQEIKDLGIVNQGPVSENRLSVLLGCVQYHFNGPAHTHAKTRSFGDKYFHW
jgi:hypothetical protein